MYQQNISKSEVDLVLDELLQNAHNNSNNDVNVNTTTTTGAYEDNVTSDATLNTGVAVTTNSTTTVDDTNNVQQRGANFAGARNSMLDFVTNYSDDEAERTATAVPFSNASSALVISTAVAASEPSLTIQNGFLLHHTDNFEAQLYPKCKYTLLIFYYEYLFEVLVGKT